VFRTPASLDDPGVRQVELWSLREDVALELEEDKAVLQVPWGSIVLRGLGKMAREALRRMTFGPVSLENAMAGRLKDAVNGPEAVAEILHEKRQLHTLLDRIQALVVRSLGLEDSDPPLLSVIPMTKGAVFELPPDDVPAARLSRFTAMRADGGQIVLESALSLHRVVLHRPDAAWLVSSLARPSSAAELAKALGLPENVAAQVIRYLAASGMVVLAEGEVETPSLFEAAPVPPAPIFAEDSDPVLATWSGRDLLFHSRSRGGRHDEPYGTTYPFLGRVSPPPLLKAVPEGARTPLPRPRIDALLNEDMSLTAALEQRTSIRTYADAPMTLEQLGELLYRSARVRSLVCASAEGAPVPIFTNRPYPSGGGSYSLEIYVTAGHIAGIERGIYYYDPCGHALVLVNDEEAAVRELMHGAQRAADLKAPPPVLLTMTARFGRVAWKYSGMWYPAILKEVGVLQQTLYLVSTAMGLAPCALGGGDSQAAAHAFGLDWRAESSVGEFIVGPGPHGSAVTSALGDPQAGEIQLMVQPVNDPDWARRSHGFQALDA
jgi:SagB-type dehydrogenase family enzyme